MVGRDEIFLDLKTEAGEVLEVEHSPYEVKRGVLADEMSSERLPQWFYARIKINRL